MQGLKIQLDESRQDIVLVELEGYLDAHTFEKLETLETLFEELFERDKHRLMVDLNKLRYISSAGAGVFIGALGVCQENEGNIALIRPSPEVKEIFDLLGVFHIFPIASSPEEALLVLNN
jgi:anti-sigma B factor antagonist